MLRKILLLLGLLLLFDFLFSVLVLVPPLLYLGALLYGGTRPSTILWQRSRSETNSTERLFARQLKDQTHIESPSIDPKKSSFCSTSNLFFQTQCPFYQMTMLQEANLPIYKRKEWIEDWEHNEPRAGDSNFWTVYSSEKRKEVTIVFRGGKGDWSDISQHPSSPIKRLLELEKETTDHFEPFINFVRSIRDYHKDKKVSVIGFSLGGLLAYIVTMELGNNDWFKSCVTFNLTTYFIPPSMHHLMRDKNNQNINPKITNWMIALDPLSSGVPLLNWKCCKPNGKTYILPPVFMLSLLKNHMLRVIVNAHTKIAIEGEKEEKGEKIEEIQKEKQEEKKSKAVKENESKQEEKKEELNAEINGDGSEQEEKEHEGREEIKQGGKAEKQEDERDFSKEMNERDKGQADKEGDMIEESKEPQIKGEARKNGNMTGIEEGKKNLLEKEKN